MTVLALIPARGGSKGIARKNVRPIAGKPLIVWTIEAALGSANIAEVVVSTDDPEIAEVARAAGASTPFIRPAELARDETPGIDPVMHAIAVVPGHDAILLLQPTSPLRTTADIDACLALAATSGAPSIVSVSEPSTHPQWIYRMDSSQHLESIMHGDKGIRRQDLPKVYALNGAIYYANIAWLQHEKQLCGAATLGFEMPPERSVDIDTMVDWALAELLLSA